MATGDQQDIFTRLRGYLPRWFGDTAQSPVINALLQGLAYSGAYVYGLYAYAKQQTRILTSSDGWLDMIAADFFGLSVQRKERAVRSRRFAPTSSPTCSANAVRAMPSCGCWQT